MNIGFERIFPTPQYPAGTSLALLNGRNWPDQAGVVEQFKTTIKVELRSLQKGRCCFCRRVLFDDYATHIEHFVEKAQYPHFTFEIVNLALSCGTCNIQKNSRNRSFTASLRKRAKREGKVPIPRCQTLEQELALGTPLPTLSASYRWVHPHIDTYSLNISVEKGWVFVGKTPKGLRTIRGVNLNALALIEQRALIERLDARGGKLSMLVGAIAELNQHRAAEVGAAIAKALRRRRNLPLK